MSRAKCPRCGKNLEVEITSISDSTLRILLYCPSCGYYQQIKAEKRRTNTIKEVKEESKQTLIQPIKRVPNTAPKAVKYLMNIFRDMGYSSFIPTYYADLHIEPPEFGCDTSPNSLRRLGFSAEIADVLSRLLRERGIYRFYKFQEEAIRNILSGLNIIIVAQTAMGKTEAFLLPSLQIAIRSKRKPSVLAIYPTKALARDQLSKFVYYSRPLGIRVGILDGDTPWAERKRIVMNPPDILITNFDMIHYWLPRRHTRGGAIVKLFTTARLLVMDEAHVYSGAFGTHVHYILKRLSRIIKRNNGDIQFVLSSATIANPSEFGSLLIGENIKTVMGRGRRCKLSILFIYCYDPPFRASAKILAELVRSNTKTLAFLNTRSSAELAYNIIKRARNPYLRNKIELHRAGLPARTRVSIENRFKKDILTGLISTPTLELGIDIGSVSAVITSLTPVDRFIQRSGRAGRRDQPGVAILLLRADDPISEYYALNPEEYFRDIASRFLEPKNKFIAKKHIYLMAYEAALTKKEVDEYAIPLDLIEELVEERGLFKTHEGWFANGVLFNKYFSRNIRGIDIQIDVFHRDKRIDQREILLALKELYPGAVYLNRGTKYVVTELDVKNRRAIVEKAPAEYQYFYTKPLYSYSAIPEDKLEQRKICGTVVYYGLLRMTISVWGYLIFKEGEKKPISQRELDKEIQYTYPTYGLFFKAPIYFSQDEDEIAGAYHATEHILIEGTYRISGGSEYDLGGISYGTSGLIVIHEALPGGNGVARLLFERFREAVKKSYELLNSKTCLAKEILNKCVFSYHCGNNNKPLNQVGARKILEKMIACEPVEGAEKAPELLRLFEKGIV